MGLLEAYLSCRNHQYSCEDSPGSECKTLLCSHWHGGDINVIVVSRICFAVPSWCVHIQFRLFLCWGSISLPFVQSFAGKIFVVQYGCYAVLTVPLPQIFLVIWGKYVHSVWGCCRSCSLIWKLGFWAKFASALPDWNSPMTHNYELLQSWCTSKHSTIFKCKWAESFPKAIYQI